MRTILMVLSVLLLCSAAIAKDTPQLPTMGGQRLQQMPASGGEGPAGLVSGQYPSAVQKGKDFTQSFTETTGKAYASVNKSTGRVWLAAFGYGSGAEDMAKGLLEIGPVEVSENVDKIVVEVNYDAPLSYRYPEIDPSTLKFPNAPVEHDLVIEYYRLVNGTWYKLGMDRWSLKNNVAAARIGLNHKFEFIPRDGLYGATKAGVYAARVGFQVKVGFGRSGGFIIQDGGRNNIGYGIDSLRMYGLVK